MTRARCALAVLLLAAPAIRAESAPAEGRLRLILNGTFAPSALDFSESRTFTEFAEEGRIDAEFEADGGPGIEVGLQWRFARHFAVAASFATASRDATGTFSAELPHPLYLDRDRTASGPAEGTFDYSERTVYVDLVWTGSKGSLDLGLFGGVALYRVESDLVDGVQYSHAYPYDSVTLTGVTRTTASDNPTGFDAGARLDYRVSRHLGLGVQGRFSRATARLKPAGAAVEIDAGGFQVAGGLRLLF